MISDERLEQFANDKRMCNVTEEIVSMAKELQAYRQAFIEPYAYEVKGILCHTLEEAQIFVGEPDPLFLKPTIPE